MTTLRSVVRDIGSRLELFVDHHLIQSLQGTHLQLHHPHYEGVAVQFDRPWEGRFSACLTVLRDGDLYRMYYRGLPTAAEGDGSKLEGTALAESHDGIHWTKPDVGIYEVGGTKKNNIVLHGHAPASHNFCPFVDTRPGVPADHRYKAMAGIHKPGVFAYASPDGLHWRRLREEPVITSEAFAFDSQNVPFWSETEGCYVFYFRTWRGFESWSNAGVRWVSRCTSDDFIHWSAPVEMEAGDTVPEHLYTQQTFPYFRAPHLYLGLAARFWPGKQVLTEAEAKSINVDPGYYGDISDAVLLSSRGGNRYDRTFMESFIRPGPGLRNWVSRTNYPALGIVPTGDGDISMYAHRDYGQPTCHAARFSLRTDGFASVQAPYAGGSMLTQPLLFTGQDLLLNYATSAAGEIRVEIQDGAGKPIPGYGLADSVPTFGDQIERVVRWKEKADVAALAGQVVRLWFVMKDADLYSLRFR